MNFNGKETETTCNGATKLKTSHSNLNLSEQRSNNSHRDTDEARQRTRRRNTHNSA
jgi:hypothetical protein